jgi:release factor glutamine methyltransferase
VTLPSVSPNTFAGDLVRRVAALLNASGIADANAEARDMVAVVAGEGRFWPTVNSDQEVPADLVLAAQSAAVRRASGMPFAYAVRRAAFRHLTLVVDERVLIPRQETEHLVDLVLRDQPGPGGVAADVGTGSGAIALSLASEGRFDRIIATDIASDALAAAKANATLVPAAATRVEFRAGELLAPLAGEQLRVLVSYPPYIAYDEAAALPASVRNWEPVPALFSGEQGLAVTRQIIGGAPALLCEGGLLALEVDCRRAHQVIDLVASRGSFRNIQLHQDLMGRDRYVLATRV